MKTIALLAVGSCAVGQSSSGVQAFRKIARVGGNFAYRNESAATYRSETSSTAPLFLGEVEDDGRYDQGDGDLGSVDLFTVGFGSVAVNFNLPSPDSVAGYVDYYSNGAGGAGGTTNGPLLYVGNYGTTETDLNVLPINGDGAGGTIALSAGVPLALTQQFDTQQMSDDPTEALLQAQVIAILSELSSIDRALAIGVSDDGTTEAAFLAGQADLQTAEADADALFVALLSAIGNDPSGMVATDQFDGEVSALGSSLTALDATISGLRVTIEADEEEVVETGGDLRIADDVDGNGNAGVTRVLADIDGDGVIEEGEVIGIINDFGDLHSYNVFFDVVTVEQSEGFSSLELVKQHIFFADHGVNTGDTGWRFQAYHEDWSAAVGDEVQGLWGLGDEALDSVSKPWLRDLLDETRFSTYGTTGLRSLMLDRRFAFLGQGSILSRTWVDQQIDHYLVGPQLGLGVVAEASMFRFEAAAMGLVGYGRVENRQSGVFSDEANHYRSDEDQFGWHSETRLTGSCQLTQRLRLDATWRWYVTGPVYDPAGSIDWDSPNFGFRQSASDEAYGNDWFFGLTYTH